MNTILRVPAIKWTYPISGWNLLLRLWHWKEFRCFGCGQRKFDHQLADSCPKCDFDDDFYMKFLGRTEIEVMTWAGEEVSG